MLLGRPGSIACDQVESPTMHHQRILQLHAGDERECGCVTCTNTTPSKNMGQATVISGKI
jgi:hypothetical protein